MRLSDDHATWLIGYCSRHNLPADLVFAEHCAMLAEQQGITDIDMVRRRAREEVKRAQYKHSQDVIAGLHAPAMKTGA
jgi:hypothetical protein